MSVSFISQFMLHVRVFIPLLRNRRMSRLTYPRAKRRQRIFRDSCCKNYQLIVHTNPTVKQKPIYTNSWWEQYSFHFSDWIYSQTQVVPAWELVVVLFSPVETQKYWASFISGCWSSTVLIDIKYVIQHVFLCIANKHISNPYINTHTNKIFAINIVDQTMQRGNNGFNKIQMVCSSTNKFRVSHFQKLI